MEASLQDCYYYYYSRCTKGITCPYRHCEAALGNEDVCEAWKLGECYDTECSFRHMAIEKKRTNIACYWESQAGGCRKPHCVFSHTRPRDEGGTILSEEEKIAAITSPPPQMAMPMADGPSPHELFYDSLPQDNIRSSVDSPTVERVVINPFEEETDEESVHGTPVKSEVSRRVNQLKVPAVKAIRSIPSTKDTKKDPPQEKSAELDFAVKSLDEIRQEKLERAKKLIEEADRLLSQEAPEFKEKTESVLQKIEVLDRKDQQDSAKTVKTKAKSSASDLPEVKSYEEILREKALASMMAAKAKKLKDQEEEERKAREEKERKARRQQNSQVRRSDRQDDGENTQRIRLGRRIVVRRRSDSPPKKEEKERSPKRINIHSRLGPKNIDRGVKGRLGTNKKDEEQSDSDRSISDVPVDRKRKLQTIKPSIKNRLGVVTKAEDSDNTDDDRNDRKATKIEDIRKRKGNEMTSQEVKQPAADLGITMSDFSSDGMSEESSADEEEVENHSEKLVRKAVPIKSVEEVRKERQQKGDDVDGDLSRIKVKSFDEILKEKAQRKQKVVLPAKLSKPTGIKRKIVINDNKEQKDDLSPPKITKKLEKPPPQKPSTKHNIGRKVLLVSEENSEKTDSNDSESSDQSDAMSSESSSSKEEVQPKLVKKKVVQEVLVKPVVEIKRNIKARVPKISPPATKRDRKAPVQLYRPPALKNRVTVPVEKATSDRTGIKRRLNVMKTKQLSESEEDEKSDEDEPSRPVETVRSNVRKDKVWGVKTFSEILREKQMKLQEQSKKGTKRSISPVDFDETDNQYTETELKRTKGMFSPIKFDSSENKPKFPKVYVTSEKRTSSPNVDINVSETRNAASSSSSQERKKAKHSNIWSSRSDRESSSSATGSRKLNIHKRLGTVKHKVVVDERKQSDSEGENYPQLPVRPITTYMEKKPSKPLKINVAAADVTVGKVKSPTVRSITSPTVKSITSPSARSITKLTSPKLMPSAMNKGDGAAQRRPSIASSTKSDKEREAALLDDNDESLNLDDTDLLEAELLELLGGSEGMKKAEKISIDQGDDDDLLLEELLS